MYLQTGTLTEDGLEVWGVVSVKEEGQKKSMSSPISDVSRLNYKDKLVSCLASCHSLTFINGQMIGDPLDIKMFEATKWVCNCIII